MLSQSPFVRKDRVGDDGVDDGIEHHHITGRASRLAILRLLRSEHRRSFSPQIGGNTTFAETGSEAEAAYTLQLRPLWNSRMLCPHKSNCVVCYCRISTCTKRSGFNHNGRRA